MVSIFFGGSVAAVGAVVLSEVEVLGDVVGVVVEEEEDCAPSPPLQATATRPRTVTATTRRRAHLRSVLLSKRAEYAAGTVARRRGETARETARPCGAVGESGRELSQWPGV